MSEESSSKRARQGEYDAVSAYGSLFPTAADTEDIKYLKETLEPTKTDALVKSFNGPAAQFCLAACVYSGIINKSAFDPSFWAKKYRDAAKESKDIILFKMLANHLLSEDLADSEIYETDTDEGLSLIRALKTLLNPAANIPREKLVDEIDKDYSSWFKRPRRELARPGVNTPDYFRLLDIEEKVRQAWRKELYEDSYEDSGEDSERAAIGFILYTIIHYLNKDLAQPNGSSTATGDE